MKGGMPRHPEPEPEPADPYPDPDPDPDSEARLPLLLPSGSAAHSHGGGGGGPRTPSSSSSSSSRTGEALASLTRGLGRHSVQPAMAGWVLSVAVTAALAGGGGGGGASDVPILLPSDHGDGHADGDGDGGPGWDGDAYPPHLPGGSGTVRYLSVLSSALSLAYPLGLGIGVHLLLSRPRIRTAGNIGTGDRGGRIGSLPPALGAALVWALALPPAALFALGGGGMGGAGAGVGASAGAGTRPFLWVLLLRLLSGVAAGGLPPPPPPPSPPAASSAAPGRPFYWLGAALGGPLTVLAGGTVRADPALGTFLAGRSAWGAGGIVLLAAASLAGTFSGLLRGGAGRRGGDGDGSGASSSASSASSSLLPSLLTPSPARPRLGSDDTSRSDRSDLFHDAVEYLEEGLLSPSPSPSRFSTPASGDGGLRERNATTPSRPGSALRRTSRGTVPPPPAAPSGTAEAQAARGAARGAAARGAAALHLGCGAAVGLAETAVPLWLLAPRSLGGLGLGQGPAAVLGAGAALLVAGLARLAEPGAPLAPVMGNEGIAGPRRAAGFPPLRRLRIGSGLLVLAPLLLLVPPSPPEGSGSASSGIPSPSLPRAVAFLTLLAASLCMCLEAAADARSLVLGGRAGGGSCGGSTGPSPTPPPLPPPPPLLGGEALGCALGGVLLCRTSLPGLAVGTGTAFLGLALHLGSYCLVQAGGGGELLLLPPSPGGGGSRGYQPQRRGSLVAELLAIPLGDARALLGLLPCGAWGRRRGGVRFRGEKHMFRRPEGV